MKVKSEIRCLLQEEYCIELSNQKVANVLAIPLMFQCMRRAGRANQMRLLGIWQKLTGGSMANLSACER